MRFVSWETYRYAGLDRTFWTYDMCELIKRMMDAVIKHQQMIMLRTPECCLQRCTSGYASIPIGPARSDPSGLMWKGLTQPSGDYLWHVEDCSRRAIVIVRWWNYPTAGALSPCHLLIRATSAKAMRNECSVVNVLWISINHRHQVDRMPWNRRALLNTNNSST